VLGRAIGRVGVADREGVAAKLAVAMVVQLAVVEVVDVIVVADRRVAAAGPVLVLVLVAHGREASAGRPAPTSPEAGDRRGAVGIQNLSAALTATPSVALGILVGVILVRAFTRSG
jgi:hypothetical protein